MHLSHPLCLSPWHKDLTLVHLKQTPTMHWLSSLLTYSEFCYWNSSPSLLLPPQLSPLNWIISISMETCYKKISHLEKQTNKANFLDPSSLSASAHFSAAPLGKSISIWSHGLFKQLHHSHGAAQIKVVNNLHLATSVSKLLNLSNVLTQCIIALFFNTYFPWFPLKNALLVFPLILWHFFFLSFIGGSSSSRY